MKKVHLFAAVCLTVLALSVGAQIQFAKAYSVRYQDYYYNWEVWVWCNKGYWQDDSGGFYASWILPPWTYGNPLLMAWIGTPWITLYQSDAQVQGYIADNPYCGDLPWGSRKTSHMYFVWLDGNGNSIHEERIPPDYSFSSLGYPEYHGTSMWCDIVNIPVWNNVKPNLVSFEIYYECLPPWVLWSSISEGCGLGLRIYN